MAYGLLHDFLVGNTTRAYEYFGAHFTEVEINGRKDSGVIFRLYAPMAEDVSVIGSFNNWDIGAHKMNKVDLVGVWEVFIPGL
ncbi:MAG: hypothetical protein EOM74_02430, partial [Methanomicrobia archaeon]|nr:hypothetical protein [Methanomicrobia archaeon]